MTSARPGSSTLVAEVANVSPHGFWILVDAQEFYLPFDSFPWFRDATIGQLSRIERPTPSHLRWPELDVDLTLGSIERPDAYPLVSRGGARPR